MEAYLDKSLGEKYYLRIGTAKDLKNKKDRAIFRFLEMLPGIFSWGILLFAIIFSWLAPFIVSLFIIFFAIYWLLRTLYFAFHLRAGYRQMAAHEKVNWLKKLQNLKSDSAAGPERISVELTKVNDWQDIYHLAVFPMYKEPIEIVMEAFHSLEKSDYPKDKIIAVLACEERARKDSEETAEVIKQEFGDKFFKFLVTWHPADLKNEIAGKGSNETWALKKTKELVIDRLKIAYENIIVSSLDVDTCVFPKYLSCLAYHYLTCENPLKTSFQPVPLYINNIWQAPLLSKIFSFSSTFWHTMNQERPEKLITFSSHAMSLKALVDVGFKQTNVVSDDSRIFWQSFLAFDGDYKVKPLFYPLSMDANVAVTFWRTMLNIYKQQRRWAYGVGDIPYFLFGFLKNKKIPLKKKFLLGSEIIENHWSWATASLIIFFLGWLPIIIGGSGFNQTLLSYNLPKLVSRIMTISMAGLVVSSYFSLLLLPPRPPQYGKFKVVIFALSWILVPIVMVLFTSFPAIESQTRWMLGKYLGFWPTEKIRKET